jgi:hypothetical protein
MRVAGHARQAAQSTVDCYRRQWHGMGLVAQGRNRRKNDYQE